MSLLQRLRPLFSNRLFSNRLFSDTLFKRLMLLMWVALVASHFLSFAAVRSIADGLGNGPPMGSPAPGNDGMGVPPLSSLPPGLLPKGGPQGPGPGSAGPGGPPPPGQPGRPPVGAPPMRSLWLDYLVRFLVIGGAAWWGAQWLSQPMRRLADASRALGQEIAQRRPAPTLDEHAGTREVRQAAQVFNTMAQRLHEQFGAQGLLMAAISHDLRTPLARLRLRLETMEPGAQTERCIADLQEMDALIGSVLSMLRDQHAPQARQRVDLRALLQAQVDDRVEQGLAVRIADDSGGEAVVLAQSEALGRILGNLIGNALRHAGSAELSLRGHPRELELCIDDHGPGIPEDQLETVFRPFYRVASSGGSGLGLYIARDLAERLGGHLTLSNRPEGGLRARLLLPRA